MAKSPELRGAGGASERASLPFSASPLRVCYVYDADEWAIHNVGRLWLEQQHHIDATLVRVDAFRRPQADHCDLFWFGYLHLFLLLYRSGQLPLWAVERSVIAVHDPSELFPDVEEWDRVRSGRPISWSLRRWSTFRLMRRAAAIVVTSVEMEAVLQTLGFHPARIPTMSALAVRPHGNITTEKCSGLSVFAPAARKDLPLMRAVAEHARLSAGIVVDLKVGGSPLPSDAYLALLDSHELYICTSRQEGGPLPAMDAMARGAVVLATPVGQLPEIIEHGTTGFICWTLEDFVEKVQLLAGNRQLLDTMRHRSVARIAATRDGRSIRSRVDAVVRRAVESHDPARDSNGALASALWLGEVAAYRAIRGAERIDGWRRRRWVAPAAAQSPRGGG